MGLPPSASANTHVLLTGMSRPRKDRGGRRRGRRPPPRLPPEEGMSAEGGPAPPVARSTIGSPERSEASEGETSNDLQLLEELDDALVGVALVLDDLARLALLGGGDLDDLLPGADPPDLVGSQPEVADRELVDRLVLGRHDPLERRVPR